MCGIVGYIGMRDAKEVLLEGLARLEYRGYDSAGVAFLDNENNLYVEKQVGKISVLRNAVFRRFHNKCFSLGIGHTRWATHGGVTQENAHPHVSASGRIALVHNGIIENYMALKQYLVKEGYHFVSETDTEVLVHLIEDFYKREGNRNLQSAVMEALKLVEGTYGIAVISVDEPYKIVAARNGSPLVIGIGEKEMFVASDVNALLAYTRHVIYLEDKELVVLKSERYKAYDLDYQRIDKEVVKVEWDINAIELGKHETYMEKEIFEQPEAIRNALRGRVVIEEGMVKFGGLNMTEEEIRRISRIVITACGTSWHAALIGKYLIERFGEIPVEVDYASEFRYRNPILKEGDLVIVISQSGETADTLEALREAKRKGVRVLGLTNVVGSTIARESDGGIYLHAGPEIGVASTKAFTNQVVSLILFAIYLGRLKNMSLYEGQRLLKELSLVPEKIQQILEQQDTIKKIAEKYHEAKNFLYLGRGVNYPVALEGALKLKEISYIHAEGYPAAEMKHGPIALIDEFMPVVFIAPRDALYEKVVSNIHEVKARHGKVIAILSDKDDHVLRYVDDALYIPQTMEEFSPLLTVVPLQMMAYHIARIKGLDVDKPRNLAKSVTVE
ncbi:glutamine--fructose-6-phosphate transaminase (isomerizing) [Thermospira aquatica]|uniref:Glutamine--fructose-6-phosphate aminotransferase [isomerizing] n=1 Tax=Thermospira aquatica TaxID=2828656 RepID=A0AAX3BD14_9SPIR|nr:glutamine--fructose-6-phosphate transaminase (isomerizing) [Thermospira aquatica]URA10175.1 glutamine--fructose-6-phosphate transaminase (isomerizing) [Thermospira aquatica]